jgi:hypothetical protein
LNYITIGRFTLPADLLAGFAAIFIGALIYRLKEKKSIGDWYWNSFFIYIVISKLSYALFNFKMFIDTPLSLLYFNGGSKGQILAFAGIAIYLFLLARNKQSINMNKEYISVYFIFFMLYETAFFVFSEHIIAALFQAILLIGFLVFYFKNGTFTTQLLLLFLMMQTLVLSLFSEILSTENVSIIILGLVLLTFQRLNKEELQN